MLSALTEAAIGLGGPVSAPRRPRWFHRYGQFGLLAVALVMALTAFGGVQSPVSRLVAVAGAVPLGLLMVRPLVAWRIAWVAALLAWIGPDRSEQSWPWHPVQILVFLPVLVVTAASQRRAVVLWVWLATCALVVAQARPGNVPGSIVLVTLLVVAGDQVGRRRQAQRELAEEEERSAVLAERARIARELHDVVAHHMSLVAVRAETAPYRLGGLAGPVRDEFGQIAELAREGMTQMRRLLGVLRSDGSEVPVAPQPGLAEVSDLVATARQAGAGVTLTLPEDAVGVPRAVQLSAYRIVQEALANAARHAPGAPVTVAVVRDDATLTVRVSNAAPRRPVPDTGTPSGHGLVGMRERAAGLGGRLTVGATPEGGFTVEAALPLAEPAGSPAPESPAPGHVAAG